MKRCVASLAPLALIVLLMGMVGCTGDTGPAGPQGPAGVGLETCMQCHTDDYTMADYIVAIQSEYEVSVHANAESFVRRGADCSRCHTTEGYQNYVATQTNVEVMSSSPIGCFACHAPHANTDFTLRKQGATQRFVGGDYDKGNSNTCAMCHQARAPDPAIEDTGTAITSSRWGPHHGPQSNMLTGTGAWDFGGTLDGSATHNTGIAEGCVHCHMSETATDGLAGGHTFGVEFEYHSAPHINANGCGCHGFDPDTADADAYTLVNDAQVARQPAIDALGADLTTLGWLTSSGLVDTANLPAEADARGAVWNYYLLNEDRSVGVHNPKYADAILTATQNYVDSQMPQ
jgi:hypothetical protein